MIKVSNEIKTYEGGQVDKLQVNSHWNDNKMVSIVIDGKQYTVCAADLKAAIDNATNIARF